MRLLPRFRAVVLAFLDSLNMSPAQWVKNTGLVEELATRPALDPQHYCLGGVNSDDVANPVRRKYTTHYPSGQYTKYYVLTTKYHVLTT